MRTSNIKLDRNMIRHGLTLLELMVVLVILAIVATVAGLALIMPLIGAVASAFDEPDTRFPAAATFIVTASGIAAFGVGAAFWGLMAGLAVYLLDRLKHA